MNRWARTTRVVAALALILVGPAMIVIPTYRATGRLLERFPALELALSRAIDELGHFRDCADPAATPAGLEPGRLWEAHRVLAGAGHALGLTAFGVDDWSVFQAMRWSLPGTAGIATTYAVQSALADLQADFEHLDPVCRHADRLDPVELREESRRSAAKVAGYLADLKQFAPRLAEARAALEQDRPVLAAMAWSLGVIEVVGWALFLLVLRQEYRAWRGRRASGAAAR